MPLLQFYTNPGQLTAAEKQDLAATLTAQYALIMPEFYVNVVFNEVPSDSFFVAGVPTDGTFVRFTADHIAVNWKTETKRSRDYLDWLGGVFTERFGPKGWTWEFHVTESNRQFWRIQSLIPPEVGTPALDTWRKAGKGIPWEGMEKL